MWYSYKEAVELFGQDRADDLFHRAWVSKWRVKLSEEEKKANEYIKMTEEAHCKIFHNWLKDNNLFHSHFWNESWQSWTKNIIIMMAKKKAMWVNKWFPDYYIRIPTLDSYVNLYIEIKKAPWKQWWWNGSLFKTEQAECLNELQKIPFTWVSLSQWSEQAINLVEDMIETLDDMTINEILELWNNRATIDYLEKVNSK